MSGKRLRTVRFTKSAGQLQYFGCDKIRIKPTMIPASRSGLSFNNMLQDMASTLSYRPNENSNTFKGKDERTLELLVLK